MRDLEANLISRVVLDKDHHAFGSLVREHHSSVRALLRRLTNGDHALADDLAQETFLTAFRKIDQYNGGKFSAWLYRIAVTQFLQWQRKTKEVLSNDLEHVEAPTDAKQTSDLKLDLKEAWGTLRGAEKSAVSLCVRENMSHSEAAEVLNLPLGTVKTHLKRAKAKLRIALLEWS